MFCGVYWNQLVCPSVCVQNLVCQSTGRGIDSHSVTALDVFVIHKNIVKLYFGEEIQYIFINEIDY